MTDLPLSTFISLGRMTKGEPSPTAACMCVCSSDGAPTSPPERSNCALAGPAQGSATRRPRTSQLRRSNCGLARAPPSWPPWQALTESGAAQGRVGGGSVRDLGRALLRLDRHYGGRLALRRPRLGALCAVARRAAATGPQARAGRAVELGEPVAALVAGPRDAAAPAAAALALHLLPPSARAGDTLQALPHGADHSGARPLLRARAPPVLRAAWVLTACAGERAAAPRLAGRVQRLRQRAGVAARGACVTYVARLRPRVLRHT